MPGARQSYDKGVKADAHCLVPGSKAGVLYYSLIPPIAPHSKAGAASPLLLKANCTKR